jgi:hypothetical protein
MRAGTGGRTSVPDSAGRIARPVPRPPTCAVISAAWRPACTLPAFGGLRDRDRLSRHVLYERVICVSVVAFIPAAVA